MRNKKLHNFFIWGFLLSSMIISAQVRVIDNKGTVLNVDSSKWTRDGNDIYNKNLTGKVGIGVIAPKATLHNAGSTVLGMTTESNTASTFTVPTASVDAYSGLTLTQTTVEASVTVSAPTATSISGRIFTVINSSASTFNLNIGTYVIAPGSLATLTWDGTNWNTPSGVSSNMRFNGLTAATASNTLDNKNFDQTWNWLTATSQTLLKINSPTLNTGTALALTANALTTGSALSITSSSTNNTSTNGLLHVANTTTNTTGTIARIQSNSIAEAGLTILGNGNIGIGTIAPSQALEVNGQVKVTSDIRAQRYLTSSNSLAEAASYTVDLSTGNVQILNVNSNFTLSTTNAGSTPATYIIKLLYTANGTYTATWPSGFLWSSGTPPTLTGTSGKVDVISIFYDGGGNYYCSYMLNF